MDYKNGKIYVIRNTVNDKLYYGSTCQKLYKRFNDHTSNTSSKTKRDIVLYKAMLELGVENFSIDLVENYPCNSKEELRAREGYYIRQFNTHIEGYNMRVAGRTYKEYYDEIDRLKKHNKYVENIEYFKTKRKYYYNKNRTENLIKRKEYVEKNKEIVFKKHKEYREKNKEKLKEKSREKYLKNKDSILTKRKQTTECECGTTFRTCDKARHFKSKKHIDFTENNI